MPYTNIVVAHVSTTEVLVYPKDIKQFQRYVILRHLSTDKGGQWEAYRRTHPESPLTVNRLTTSHDLGVCIAACSLDCDDR